MLYSPKEGNRELHMLHELEYTPHSLSESLLLVLTTHKIVRVTESAALLADKQGRLWWLSDATDGIGTAVKPAE